MTRVKAAASPGGEIVPERAPLMSRVAAYTPLRVSWPHQLATITRTIRIVERPTFDETDWRFWNLRRTDEQEALQRSHWLGIESECEAHEEQAVLEELALDLRSAMLGFQLWAPVGWDGILIKTRKPALTIHNVSIAEPYQRSRWARQLGLESLNPSDLGTLVEGTLGALKSQSVPQTNPLQFLEIGLQTAAHHPRVGALLWILGLDALLAAERQQLFAKRLIRLLGAETPTFPVNFMGRRPMYTVGDVAADIYDLRNLIAHGKEILQKYRDQIEIQLEPESLAYLHVEKWSYGTLLAESALFTLLAALRKVITAGLLEVMDRKREWERWLDQ